METGESTDNSSYSLVRNGSGEGSMTPRRAIFGPPPRLETSTCSLDPPFPDLRSNKVGHESQQQLGIIAPNLDHTSTRIFGISSQHAPARLLHSETERNLDDSLSHSFQSRKRSRRAYSLDIDPKDTNRCEFCHQEFDTPSDLRHHQRNHSAYSDRPRPCPSCTKRFLFQKDVYRHMISVHSDERPFGCPNCTRAFKRRDGLKRHMQRGSCRKILDSDASGPSTPAAARRPNKRRSVALAHRQNSPFKGRAQGEQLSFSSDSNESVDGTQLPTHPEDHPVGDSSAANQGFSESEQENEELSVSQMGVSGSEIVAHKCDDASEPSAIDLREHQLRRLEDTLDHLRLSISSLRLDSEWEVAEDSETESDSSWCDIDDEEVSDDAISLRSADGSWILPFTSQRSRGAGYPEGESSNGGGLIPHGGTTNLHDHGHSRRKRKHGSGEREEDNGEQNNDETPVDPPPDPPTPDSGRYHKKIIPCFADGCRGKDAFASYLVRYAHKHHSLPYCPRCCRKIEDTEDYESHGAGNICDHHCISSSCLLNEAQNSEKTILPSKRRHRRQKSCPPIRKVAVEDLWQYMYYSLYPDRDTCTPNPIIAPGFTHPHGSRRICSKEKSPLPDTRLVSFEQRLAETQAELKAIRQSQASETELQELRGRQQEDQRKIERLQIIVRGLVEQVGILPDHLRELIRMEAPSTLELQALPTFAGGLRNEPAIVNDNLWSVRVDSRSQGYETASGRNMRHFTTAAGTSDPFLIDMIDTSFDNWPYLDPQLLEGRM